MKAADTDALGMASLARSWAEVEQEKRAIRREPGLKPMSLADVMEYQKLRGRGCGMKRLNGQKPADAIMVEDPEPPAPAPPEPPGNS